MSVRDLVIAAVIFGSIPFCFFRPWIGVLIWTWFGVMAPHRFSWAFYDFPFAQYIAIATLAGVPFASDRRWLPRSSAAYIMLALWLQFALTTIFALYPAEAWPQLEKVSKIFLFTFLGLILFQNRTRLRYLVLVLTLSIGLLGLKGGLWVLRTGGIDRVEGPEGSFIGGNTGMALGLVMALPFFFFLARDEENKWLRRLLWVIFAFSIPAIAFTYSRGGLLGMVGVLMLIAVKTNRKTLATVGFVALVAGVLSFAPAHWFQRADTIVNYQGDGSAESRLFAWRVAFEFALDHPLLGGGFFATSHEEIYWKYAQTLASLVPHSIWFSVMSEHGFTGLLLFVSMMVAAITTLRRLRRRRNGHEPARWIVSYSHMLEVSILGYAICGTFLNAAYANVFYWVVAMVILLEVVAAQDETQQVESPSKLPLPTMVTPTRAGYVWNRRLS